MAIEIIPKSKITKVFWRNILFYFSLVLLLAVITGYFILEKKAIPHIQQQKADIQQAIDKEKTEQEKTTEREFQRYQKEVEDFLPLLEAHKKSSNLFKFLESCCHPYAWFYDFNLDAENSLASFSGKTQSFLTLAQQISIFQKEELIKDVNLSSISLGEGGEVIFELVLSFEPKIFK